MLREGKAAGSKPAMTTTDRRFFVRYPGFLTKPV
jgi:hypothetical protein